MKKRITAALAAVLLLCGCASSAADGTTDPAADGKNEDTAVLVIENITQDPEPAERPQFRPCRTGGKGRSFFSGRRGLTGLLRQRSL